MAIRTTVLATLLLLSAACVRRSGPDAAAKPLRAFPHATHADAGIACTACHAPIEQAGEIGPTVHVKLPAGDAAQACQQCHDTVPAAPAQREYPGSIHFSHAAHLGYVQGDCTRCHEATDASVRLVGPQHARDPAPGTATCTSCHDHGLDYAQARCQTCHTDLKRFRLQPVADFRHAGDFLRTHGQMARASALSCAACHDQTSCAECHAQTTRPFKPDVQWPERVGAAFIHRGDYESRHMIDASADPASCRRCHGSASCDACHNERGVSPLSASGLTRLPPSHRQPNWNAGIVHGVAARQDIVSCAGCHDQGARSTCVTCHRSVNPHPPGWSARHNLSSDVASNSMCRICHAQ
jgi:Cytochrome c7 and related cytochrome c